ncbi:MAG: DUF262 domain-containing protein [Deltaproteobacteria bacterium]|nr:DUF262 domain-containing protein [Deltaproteobacteria bacterium]
MKKTDTTVSDLVTMIERGELLLPEMQRRYVWRAPRVRDLLDSLYRGYPSGSILVWESDQPVPTQGAAVSQQASSWAGHKLLLDGQQRLTSLSAVLRGEPVNVRGRRRAIDILFNLDHPEGAPVELTEEDSDIDSPLEDAGLEDEEDDDQSERTLQERLNQRTFVVASKSLRALPNWISVSDVLGGKKGDWELLKEKLAGPDDPRFDSYMRRIQRLRKIRDYPYVVQVLERGLSYEEVAEIFVRVNSLGVKLRSSDLALAQITAKWRDSLRLFEEFQEECEQSWFTLDLGLLVRGLVVFATGQSRFKTVGNLSLRDMQDGWEKAKRGIRFAIDYLRTNADIEDESLLSSPFFYFPIAAYAVKHDERVTDEATRGLLHWLLVANARGHYSSSAETTLDVDLNILFRGGHPKDLTQVVQQKYGRLKVDAADFEKRGVRNALFATAFLAMKANGALDWESGLGLSLTHQGRLHYIEHHHVFPKSLLQKAGYEKAEINEIANLAFITGRANRRIGNKPPEQYLAEIVARRGKKALEDHCVPADPALHRMERYREFLAERRRLLAEVVNGHFERALASA